MLYPKISTVNNTLIIVWQLLLYRCACTVSGSWRHHYVWISWRCSATTRPARWRPSTSRASAPLTRSMLCSKPPSYTLVIRLDHEIFRFLAVGWWRRAEAGVVRDGRKGGGGGGRQERKLLFSSKLQGYIMCYGLCHIGTFVADAN